MFFFRSLLTLLVLTCAGAPAWAAPAPMPFERIGRALNGVHVFNDVAIAPDGGHFAYTDDAVHIGDVSSPRRTRRRSRWR